MGSQSDINCWRGNYQFCILLLSVLERPQLVGRLGDHVQASIVLVAAAFASDPVSPGNFSGRQCSGRGRCPLAARAAAVAVPAALEGDVAGDVSVVSLDLAFVLSLRYDSDEKWSRLLLWKISVQQFQKFEK